MGPGPTEVPAKRMVPRLSLLDDATKVEIHERTLGLLSATGVRYASPKALRLLEGAGAQVDAETQIARLPRDLVESALRAAPHDCLLAGRVPERDALLDGNTTYVTLDGFGARTLDYHTMERRPSTGQDLADALRIADHLPEVGVVWNTVTVTESAANVEVLAGLAVGLRNTGKHIQGEAQRPEEVPFMLDMLKAASADGAWHSDRPFFSVVYSPVSPLAHEREMCEAALELVKHGVPMSMYTLPLCGATAPVTLAGGILQTNAEILSSLVLFQVAAPGTPVIYEADCGILDMRANLYACSGPEVMLMRLGLIDMGRYYDLPVASTGFSSDAKEITMMTGLDGGMSGLLTMLGRCDLLTGIGMLDAAQTLYLPKLVLDAEVVRQCRRVAAGIVFDEEHLMADLIGEIGPGGQFLGAKATSRFLRAGEHVHPRLFKRGSYEGGRCTGARDIERATAEVEEILATHPTPPLPPAAEERFAEIIAAAAGELAAR